MPNAKKKFDQFKNKNKWIIPDKMKGDPGAKLHYSWEPGATSVYMMCIKSAPFKNQKLTEVSRIHTIPR